jgi:hypothetical protein
MRRTLTLIAVGFLGLTVLTGCATDPPKSSKACFEALDKGHQLLAVPDHPAAKGWHARAKKDCLADQTAAVDGLEKDIAASEAKTAEAKKKFEDSFKPKPASASLMPGFVEAAVKYRDKKKRETCETDPCAEVTPLGTLLVRQSTKKGARDTFRVFARIPKERAGCDQLGGASEQKSRSENETQIKVYCAITGGPLKGLFALIEQEKERPETHVVVFTEKWKENDAELKAKLGADGAAAPAKP